MTYMLHEAAEGAVGEDFYALGHRWRKEGDGQVRYMTPLVPWQYTPAPRLAAGLRQGWDAAYPPAAPPNVEFVAGYIGGGTPHVWTDAEWAASLSKSTAQLRLPVFVRVPPTTRDPVVEANFCADWADAHDHPKGSLIALDYETAVNAPYLLAFDGQLVKRGYRCIVYGSRSFVMQNPEPSGGYWTATWNNVPHLDSGAAMTQYGGDVTLGQPYDLNVARNDAPLGGDMSATGPASWDSNDWKSFNANVNSDVIKQLRIAVGPDDASVPAGAYFSRVENKLDSANSTLAVLKGEADETQAAVAALAALMQSGGADAQTIADLVIAGVGPEVAADVATVLGTKLLSA